MALSKPIETPEEKFLAHKATSLFKGFDEHSFVEALYLFKKMGSMRYRASYTEEGKQVFRYELCLKGDGCDVCVRKYAETDTVTSGKALLRLQEKLEEVNKDSEYAHAYTVHEFARSYSICGDCLIDAKTLLKTLETKLANTSKHHKKYAPKMKGYQQCPLVNKMYYI